MTCKGVGSRLTGARPVHAVNPSRQVPRSSSFAANDAFHNLCCRLGVRRSMLKGRFAGGGGILRAIRTQTPLVWYCRVARKGVCFRPLGAGGGYAVTVLIGVSYRIGP